MKIKITHYNFLLYSYLKCSLQFKAEFRTIAIYLTKTPIKSISLIKVTLARIPVKIQENKPKKGYKKVR